MAGAVSAETGPAPELASARRALARRLGAWLDRAVSAYETVATRTPPEAVKDFAAHQAACRGALAHIEAVLRLAASEGGAEAGAEGGAAIDRLRREARAALARLRGDAPAAAA